MNLPKVTFGIVNCNRLFYFKSCLESLLYTTEDYENKEIIVVDNASVEEGTEEYLSELEDRGFKVFRQKERDPSNEFAKALNIIVRESTGDFICPLQGDMQFVLKGAWLKGYVDFYSNNKDTIGCMLLDAQRNVTNNSHSPFKPVSKESDKYKFLIDMRRSPIMCAGDVLFSREVLEKIAPWSENNKKHEGGQDSETDMLSRVRDVMISENLNWHCAVPIIPPSVAIQTDPRGTNARVRGNKRYGKYFSPKEGFQYYEIFKFDDVANKHDNSFPIGIEDMAVSIGWEAPIDSSGNWKKNPINPDNCHPSDYVVLYEEAILSQPDTVVNEEDADYIKDWLEE